MTAPRDWAKDREIQPETPLPYRVVKSGHGSATIYRCVQLGEDDRYTTLELKPRDAAYLVHAANTLPAALEELERLQLLIDEYAAAVLKMRAVFPIATYPPPPELAIAGYEYDMARDALLAAASKPEGV